VMLMGVTVYPYFPFVGDLPDHVTSPKIPYLDVLSTK
jgi:hypothetical protein